MILLVRGNNVIFPKKYFALFSVWAKTSRKRTNSLFSPLYVFLSFSFSLSFFLSPSFFPFPLSPPFLSFSLFHFLFYFFSKPLNKLIFLVGSKLKNMHPFLKGLHAQLGFLIFVVIYPISLPKMHEIKELKCQAIKPKIALSAQRDKGSSDVYSLNQTKDRLFSNNSQYKLLFAKYSFLMNIWTADILNRSWVYSLSITSPKLVVIAAVLILGPTTSWLLEYMGVYLLEKTPPPPYLKSFFSDPFL